MDEKVQYGHGVLSQGEIIMSREHDRLMAKRAFLQVYDHLIRHEEVIKAKKLFQAVPWHLENDGDIRRMEALSDLKLSHVVEDARGNSAPLLEKIVGQEGDEVVDFAEVEESSFQYGLTAPRVNFIYQRTMAQNPATVLDIGAGWGFMAYRLTRDNVNVTAFAPYVEGTQYCRKRVAEESLSPITWIPDLFSLKILKGTKFDVVIAGEVIEHILNDADFLVKAISCCKKSLILTTPFGSVDKGLPKGKDMYLTERQHVRAYSYNSFTALLDKAQRFYEGKLKITNNTVPEGGKPSDNNFDVRSFTAVIEKDLSYDYSSIENKLS